MKNLKRLLPILIISSFIMAEESKGIWFSGKSTTLGVFDGKFGFDFINISRTIYEKDNNEFFIGFGTMIMMTHFGAGWKKYYETDKKIKPFSCASIFSRMTNKMAVTNGSSIREDNCILVSGGGSIKLFELKKKDNYLNFGIFASYDFRNDPFGFPFINIEFKK